MTGTGPGYHEHGMKPNRPIGIWIAIGVAIGTAIGVATDNLGLWIALGCAIGAALGFTYQAERRKDGDEEGTHR